MIFRESGHLTALRRPARRCLAVLLLLGLAAPAQQTAPQQPPPTIDIDLSHANTLQYGVEWRLVRAGVATLKWTPEPQGFQGDLHLESAGLVNKLYRVNDDYRIQMTKGLCASNILMHAEEGKRRRETKVAFEEGKAHYVERDLLKNNVVLAKETPVPPCVHDYVGGLNKLRTYKLEPGQSVQIPMTDGKKFAQVRVQAQEREQVKTPTGTYQAMRYEVFMFNDVLIKRKARMFVWLTEDARRLPVQIRVRLQFLVGTITLQLEKEERT